MKTLTTRWAAHRDCLIGGYCLSGVTDMANKVSARIGLDDPQETAIAANMRGGHGEGGRS